MKSLAFALFGLLVSATRGAYGVAPLIGDVPDQVVAQDTASATHFFTVGDGETAFGALVVTASSANPALVPSSPEHLVLGGANSQRTVTVVPAPGVTGAALITLTVTDGEALEASSTFELLVTSPNTPPTLSDLASYRIVPPGESTVEIPFTVADAETPAEGLDLVASSSNPDLAPNAGLLLGGSGTARTLTLQPASGLTGAAVVRIRVTDELGAFVEGELVFVVFDPDSPNNRISQPRGLFVLDSGAGTIIGGVSMRDANIRDEPFVDGYVLRTDWKTLEPDDDGFDFTIVLNIFERLPPHQRLSLVVGASPEATPPWLLALPGVTTWTAGSPAVTAPLPWDLVTQDEMRELVTALGDLVVDGAPLRDHSRLEALNVGIPGMKSGIRDPEEIRIREMPGYSRENAEAAVATHLRDVTGSFDATPVQVGFWNYNDSTPSPSASEQLRLRILAEFDGVQRDRVGFWMENLAASRPAAGADPWSGLPGTAFASALFLSQDEAYAGFQSLGSWSRPFNDAHVDNNLNGSPEDGMDYAFNTFQCGYFEVYQADVDFAPYEPELQRWRDLLASLPRPPGAVVFVDGFEEGDTSNWS